MSLVEIQYHPPCTYHKDGDHRERQGYYLCDCGASSAWHKTVPVERCKDGYYDAHWINNSGVVTKSEWCPGAEIGGDE